MLTSLFADTIFHLMDSHPEPVFVKDKDLRYLYVNKAYIQLNNLNEGTIVGRNVFDVLPFETAQKCHEMDAQVVATGRMCIKEDTFQLNDSTYQRGEITLSPQMNEFGQVIRLMGIVRDVSERFNRELNLQAMNDYLAGRDHRRHRPVCASCKCLQSKSGHWEHVATSIRPGIDETYLTHGICESCSFELES